MKARILNECNITVGIYNMQYLENGRYLWLAVAAANYLTAVKRKKVAVVELSGKNSVEQLAEYFNADTKTKISFDLFGVKYYPYYNEKFLPAIMGDNYSYIIFNNVQLFGNRNIDSLNYRKRIVVGSLKPWESMVYKENLARLSSVENLQNYCFFAEYFEHKEVKHLEKENNISFGRLPTNINPFQIKRTEFQFFELFL